MKQKHFFFSKERNIRSRNLFVTVVLICFIYSCQGGEKKGPGQEPAIGTSPANKTEAKDTSNNNKQPLAGEASKTAANESIKDTGGYIQPQMIFVKGGTFKMGNNKEGEGIIDEAPEHTVTVDDFWIGKYEVTVAEFRKFINSHTYVTDAEKAGFTFVYDKGSLYRKNGANWEYDVIGNKRVNQENHPVIHVSRNDAEAYCNWLSKKTGKKYRLLTEAEWEYAAKGGPKHEHFLYSGSNDMGSVGWYADNSEPTTHPVGLKKPNGLGVYDMSGNAWEWCSDWYGPYSAEAQTNPKGPSTGTDGVLRGGGWRYFDIRTRVAARRGCLPGFNGSGPGFRLAYDK